MSRLGKNNDNFDSRFEFDAEPESNVVGSATVEEPENTKKAKKTKKGKKSSIGARIGKTIGALALVGVVGAGAYLGTGAFVGFGPTKNLTESGRVNSLVAEYTNDDLFCSLPQDMLINKAYDISYASGEKLVSSLKKNDVKYCEVLNEYYTPSGEDIAILTYDVATLDVIPAIKVGVGFSGAEVYMPVEGYTLSGNMCYKEGQEQLIKVVSVSQNGDYSHVTLDKNLTETSTIQGASLVNVEEVSTKTYDEILDMTLICDVADGAVLDENNQCLASFNLVPKTYKFNK